ncbi:MAG: hypothetical protein EOP42_23045, partial [Sphingobacteriaceae bacterium]
VHTIKLKNQHGKVFYDKLTYIYLEMPNFGKLEYGLATRLDQWLYFIKNLEDFQQIPAIFKDEVFTQAFEKAELANFKQDDLDRYEYSLKVFRDNKATYDYAIETAREEGTSKGIAEGMAQGLSQGLTQGISQGLTQGLTQGISQGLTQGITEGILKVAKALKASGIATDIIAATTGLSIAEIEKL